MWDHTLDIALVHCQGEIGDVILGGAPPIPGATVLEQMLHLNTVDDGLRRFVTLEPRGAAQMSVNLVMPPCRPDADAGFIVLQSDRAHPMSGSNAICVVTALLETGRVPITGAETVVRLDTAAGLVVCRARCAGGRCVSVSLDNVPAFVAGLDVEIASALGPIRADIAWGGVWYALVDVAQTGLAIEPGQARALAAAGVALRAEIAAQVPLRHPIQPGLDQLAYVMFRSQEADGAIRTCTTLPPGRVDRSPCGTGSSANLASLHARGLVRVGDVRRSRSIIGGEFLAEMVSETEVGGVPAIVPRITGQAWIYGRQTLRRDASDPFPGGFMLSDTWGDACQT